MSSINVVVGDPNEQEQTPSASQNTIAPPPESEDEYVAVPDTGGNIAPSPSNAPLLFSGVTIIFVVIAIIAILIFKSRRHHIRVFDMCKSQSQHSFRIHTSRKTVFLASAASLLVALVSITSLQSGSKIGPASATDGGALTVVVSDEVEINAYPDGGNAFATGYDTVTVTTPTTSGYTLYAYSSSSNLSSENDDANAISGIESSDDTSILGDNTWGIATIYPEDMESQVWWSIPDSSDAPFVIKNTLNKNDTTTRVYYGVNVTPDLPRGTYRTTVNYVAIANVAPEGYEPYSGPINTDPSNPDDSEDNEYSDGQDEQEFITYTLYFNANQGFSAPGRRSCTTAVASASCQLTIPPNAPARSGYIFLGWAESALAMSPDYQAGDAILLSSDQTLYAVWEKRVNIYTTVVNDGGTVSGSVSNVAVGTTYTITFTPDAGYEIEYVTVNGAITSITGNTLDVVASEQNTTVTVSYKSAQETPAEPSTYRAIFNANNGSGAPSNLECTASDPDNTCSIVIPNATPTRTNYYFLGWATSSNAASAAKYPGDLVNLSDDSTFYAVWAPIYTLRLNSNNGPAATSAAAGACHPNATTGSCSISIPATQPSYSKHTFLGWATSSDATTASYQPGSSLSISTNTTLYAVWQNEAIAIHFINLGTYGNATLLENKGSYALVDTGPSSSSAKVSDYLDSLGITKLDFIIISHPHGDHNGNAVSILNKYQVGTVYEKTYTEKDLNAGAGMSNHYNEITETANAKNVPIVYVDQESKFVEAPGKSGSVYLNGTMRVHFFNTVQRIGHTKQSGEAFDYFSSDYWAGKSENLNSLVNLIRVNGHNVLLTGDLNNYNILNYIMTEKVDVAYKNNQTLDVYSVPHHANYNCTGNRQLGVNASYFLVTANVDAKFGNGGSYRITNDTVTNTSGTTYTSCFAQMSRDYLTAYYSANNKDDSKATIFDLTGANVEIYGGYRGWDLSERVDDIGI